MILIQFSIATPSYSGEHCPEHFHWRNFQLTKCFSLLRSKSTATIVISVLIVDNVPWSSTPPFSGVGCSYGAKSGNGSWKDLWNILIGLFGEPETGRVSSCRHSSEYVYWKRIRPFRGIYLQNLGTSLMTLTRCGVFLSCRIILVFGSRLFFVYC